MQIDTSTLYPNHHFRNYQYFLLNQYHLKVDGLWVHNNNYYIFCPEIDDSTLAIDGSSLKDWYRDHSILGTRTLLVNKLPSGATRVKEQKKENLINFEGSPRNFTDFLNDLLSLLPKDFPEFKLQDNNTGILTLLTHTILDAEQEGILREAIHKMRVSIRLETNTAADLEEIKQPLLPVEMVILNPKIIKGLKSTKALKVWESDEDFWNDRRGDLLKPSIRKNDFFSEGFDIDRSGCIISDSVMPPNLRNFLTLYSTVYLTLPILQNSDRYWKCLGVTEDELLALIEMDKVRVLLTQPLHRYNPRIIDILSEQQESRYLSPRRLASITVADLRKRNPFLFPTFSDEIKHELLHHLHHKKGLLNFSEESYKGVIPFLPKIWDNYLENIHRLGVYGLSNYSSYHFFDAVFKSVGKDYGVELLDSIPSVDFGAALQANVIPKYWERYSDEKLLMTVANFYSGIPNNLIPKNFPYSNTSVDKVLVINREVPILDLAKSFTHHDIDRFRNLIFDLTRHKKDQEELNRSLKMFNEHVLNFENSSGRLNTLDVTGFVIDSSMAVAGADVPLASWVAEQAGNLLSRVGVKSGTVQKLLDEFNAIKAGSHLPDAVLVARMRSQLKESWFQSQLRKIRF